MTKLTKEQKKNITIGVIIFGMGIGTLCFFLGILINQRFANKNFKRIIQKCINENKAEALIPYIQEDNSSIYNYGYSYDDYYESPILEI